jgi:hypothetical protein
VSYNFFYGIACELFFHLPVVLVVIYNLVGGQFSLKNMVDDENLTAFIIRYR